MNVREQLQRVEKVTAGSKGKLALLLVTGRNLTLNTVTELRKQHETAARLLRQLEDYLK